MFKFNLAARLTAITLFATASIPLVSLPAHAKIRGLKVCNDSHERVSVALAKKSGDQWITSGWWKIDPGDCKKLIDGKVKNRTYGIYARGLRGGKWLGNKPLCVENSRFEYHYADSSCAYGKWVNFDIIRPGKMKYTYSLTPRR